MRRGCTVSLTALLALGVALGMAGPALGHLGAQAVEYNDTWEAHGTLKAGYKTFEEAEDCLYLNSCPAQENQRFVHLDISEAMSHYESEAEFYVSDSHISTVTLWYACVYDGQGDPLWCYLDDEADWGMQRQLSDDVAQEAEQIRLFPIKPAPAVWHLKLNVS